MSLQTYRIDDEDGIIYLSVNLDDAKSEISVGFGDYDENGNYTICWERTPYQTADACHKLWRAIKLAIVWVHRSDEDEYEDEDEDEYEDEYEDENEYEDEYEDEDDVLKGVLP